MALGKITKTLVERLKPGDLVWDADHREVVKGFGARRQRRDVFYLLRYRINGRQRFITIGRHGSPWTPDTARSEAKRLLGMVASRADPATERVRPAETFDAEVARYLDRKRAAMKPRAYIQVARHLQMHSKPLHRQRLAEIDKRAIAVRLDQIEKASGAVTRNRVRSSLSAFFARTIEDGLIEINPVTGTAKAEEGPSRDRVLSKPELVTVWRACAEDQFGDIVRLLILTGQRREEIGGLRWSEIDQGSIVLPPARTKNRREHALPLSVQARAILDRQPRRGNRDFIFGYGRGPYSGWGNAKAALDARVGRVKPWRLHDLRRTAATMMAELGVFPHIIEAILNHVSGHRAGVAGIYNRARYEQDMRAALERWCRLLSPKRSCGIPSHNRIFASIASGKI